MATGWGNTARRDFTVFRSYVNTRNFLGISWEFSETG
jgi:hypothetical protein